MLSPKKATAASTYPHIKSSSQDVQFVEDSFPFKNNLAQNPVPQILNSSNFSTLSLLHSITPSEHNTIPAATIAETRPITNTQVAQPLVPQPDQPSPPLNTPTQTAQQAAPSQTSTHSMITRNRDNTRKPKTFPHHVTFLTSLDSEPTSYTQASAIPEWRQAMASEIDALARNSTWRLVPPPNQRVIGCKWVYKLKKHANGSIDRYKARLVAKGFHQVEGVDFFDTYSPIVRPATIRLLLSLAVSSNWPIKQLDVHNAFLHGDLNEEVYMQQPPGFIDNNRPDHVCLLTKSLYGLKQAPRAWFQKLSTSLVHLGFQASQYDPSLFYSH